MNKLYGERDASALDEAGGYYMRHLIAMTSEGLDSKAAIAAELGHRDMQIDTLIQQAKAAHAAGHALGLPGGTDITVELLPAVEAMKTSHGQVLAALQKYEEAFDLLFGQCCSNGIFDAWGKPVNCTTLNEAHELAGKAIKYTKENAA